MKRLVNLTSVLVLVAMLGFGGRSITAHAATHARAPMINAALCSSAPIGVPSNHDLVRGLFNGVVMATRSWRAKMKTVGVNLRGPYLLDDARSDGVSYDTNHERQNALGCLSRTDTLGYIGTLNSGAALVSEPILNQGGMTMISPANTNPTLTSPSSRVSQEPATYHHRLPYVTYYRTVTTDNLQGPAGAAFLHTILRVHSYFLVDDKFTYGAGLAGTFDAYAAHHLGMTRAGIGHIDATSAASITESANAIADEIVSKKPDAVYCGCNLETSYPLPRDLRSKGYTGPYMGGDAIVASTWVTDVGSGGVANFATSVGPDISKAAPLFKRLYKQNFPAFFKKPGPQGYDATAFDASNIALNAIYNAAKSGKLATMGTMFKRRALVTKYVSQTRWKGVTGLTTFDRNGDTTNRIISIYSVRGGKWAYIARAPKLPGISPT